MPKEPRRVFKTVKVTPAKARVQADSLPDVGVIKIYTDGSCTRNGKPDARGGYSCYVPEAEAMSGGWPLLDGITPTNNRAEFSGFLKAVDIADAIDRDAGIADARTLLVITDSELLQKTVSRWLMAWRKKGWVKMDGAQVANLDLCKRMADACDRRAIVVRHVKAHTDKNDEDSVGNRQADYLATTACKTQAGVHA